MINIGKSSNVLERTEVNTEASVSERQQYNTRVNSDFAGNSISNDLMRNYAEKGLLFEESLREDVVCDNYQYEAEDVDVTPSLTTMQFTLENDDYEEDDLQSSQRSYKISSRGKIMITVYALVVATIIALIAMNARVLKTMEESIKQKEAAVGSLVKQTQMLSEELTHVSSEEVISQKAVELGMSK